MLTALRSPAGGRTRGASCGGQDVPERGASSSWAVGLARAEQGEMDALMVAGLL